MALITSINNVTTPVSYNKSMTSAVPLIRKSDTPELEKTSNKPVTPAEPQIDDPINKRTVVTDTAFVEVTPEEQQKFEEAQQKAQRAKFDLQTYDLSPTQGRKTLIFPEGIVPPEALQKENPAITLFNQLQNIEEAPRQGQEVDHFV